MNYGEIPGVNKKISRVLMGVMWLNGKEDPEIFDVLDHLYAKGVNAFDTAHCYGPGTEGLLGRWVNARGNRDDVVILAKGAHHGPDGDRVNPDAIEQDMNESMERINTDYFDLYVLHRDDPSVPVGPIVEALNDQIKRGRIGAFGGSNWTTPRIAEANAYAKEKGLIGFSCSSPCFNMVEQINEPWKNCIAIGGTAGESERAWYRDANMPLFCWSSLAGGFLTGTYSRESRKLDDDRTKFVLHSYDSEDNFRRMDRAQELADAKGVSLAQIALAYVLQYNLDTYALMGCVDKAQADDNLQALDINISAEELDYIDLKTEAVAS